MDYKKAIIKIILFNVFSLLTFSKVTPPNYDFSLDQLKIFMPGQNKAGIEAKHGKGTLLEKGRETETIEYNVEYKKFKFPISVQFFNNQVLDFHAKLPSYFLHNIFHQSLINRYQKQNIYKHQNEHAIYIWNNQGGNKHVYMAGCAITCFPIFYAVIINQPPAEIKKYTSVLENLRLKENYKKEGLIK